MQVKVASDRLKSALGKVRHLEETLEKHLEGLEQLREQVGNAPDALADFHQTAPAAEEELRARRVLVEGLTTRTADVRAEEARLKDLWEQVRKAEAGK
ncbi:MAG: hypothetical protein HUU15_18475 [Candidatus Brocadiae bacterium]|nr:hypothetical protein [Candidatus Brocadiia bacterium]